MTLFISQLQQSIASQSILCLGCTCEIANFISMLIHVIFLVLLVSLFLRLPWIRFDTFFRSLLVGGILLVISEALDWWHIVQVAIQQSLIFSYGIDFGVEILQLSGFLIILIGLIKASREISI